MFITTPPLVGRMCSRDIKEVLNHQAQYVVKQENESKAHCKPQHHCNRATQPQYCNRATQPLWKTSNAGLFQKVREDVGSEVPSACNPHMRQGSRIYGQIAVRLLKFKPFYQPHQKSGRGKSKNFPGTIEDSART